MHTSSSCSTPVLTRDVYSRPSTHPPSAHPLHLVLSPTQVIDGTMLKIYAWYDNEYGYSCRMVDLAAHVAKARAAASS